MGGAESEITDATTDVVVESAIFDPVSIRRTAFRYALRSEASLRFEKGQEHRLARIGADRTARLIAEWAGGAVATGAVDTNPTEPEPGRVAFRPARVDRLLGTRIETDEQRALLARVGIATEPAPAGVRVAVAGEPQPLEVDAGDAETPRRDRARPGGATSSSRPTSPRRSRASAATSSCPRSCPHTPMPAYRHPPLRLRDTVRDRARRRRPDRDGHPRARLAGDGGAVPARPGGHRARAKGRRVAARSSSPTRCRASTPSCASHSSGSLLDVVVGEPPPGTRGRRDLRDRQGLRRHRRRAPRTSGGGWASR